MVQSPEQTDQPTSVSGVEAASMAQGQRAIPVPREYLQRLGERLKAAREQRGLMQSEAAELIPCSKTLLSDYELGKAKPGLGFIYAAADTYGCSVKWLFDSTDDVPSQGDLDHAAASALARLPLNQQRALLLDYWPELQKLYGLMRRQQENIGVA